MNRKIIKNGTIVSDNKIFKSDIEIKNEKIVAINKNIKLDAEIFDASNMFVFPGGIDVHVHFQLPFCGTVSKDDFENGSKAAACGGVTFFIDFAIQKKGSSLIEAFQTRRKQADGKVAIDYSLHCGITDWNEKTRKQMNQLIKNEGVSSFKVFMIYRREGWIADDKILYDLLTQTTKNGSIIMLHAESDLLLDYFIEKYKTPLNMKKYGAYLHTLTRPCITEYEAIQRATTLAKETKGRLYVVHISSKEGGEIIANARKQKLNVWGETCPHYLLLNDNVFKRKDGHLFATCPQIKKKHDNDGLWQSLSKGYLNVVSTDTCTFDRQQKALWKGDFTKIPFGLPGVETLIPLLFSYGVKRKRFSVTKFVELISTNPAKLFGVYPKKGCLKVNSDADILVYDPTPKRKINYKDLQTNCDFSPFQGFEVEGLARYVFSRGNLVAKDGKFVGNIGWGRFVKRKPFGKI